MKNLEKSKNIYVCKGTLYVDFQKDKKRKRVSTSLKYSAFSFSFVKKNYEMFLDKSTKIEALKTYRKLEDEFVEKKLIEAEEKETNKNKIKENHEKYSFYTIINNFKKEKIFLKNNTKHTYEIIFNRILSYLQDKNIYYIDEFKRENSIDFVNFLKENELKQSSIKVYCIFFKAMFKYAVENKLIFENPFFMPKMKREEVEEIDPFNLNEIITLIKNAQNELRTFLIIAFFTGARTGEILALTWNDIDFVNKEIYITKTLSQDGKTDTPKTFSSKRVIDMLELVEKELLKLKYKEKSEPIIKVARPTLRKYFLKLLQRLNLKYRRLYDTRHSFASLMLSRGEEPMWVGCKMLGHKDLRETYKTYAKYLPKDRKERATFLKSIKII